MAYKTDSKAWSTGTENAQNAYILAKVSEITRKMVKITDFEADFWYKRIPEEDFVYRVFSIHAFSIRKNKCKKLTPIV